MTKLTTRTVNRNDFDAIAKIYAQEVLHGLATFEAKPPTASELASRWQTLQERSFPYLVATIDDQVVGYAYAGPYRARAAYQNSIENSVYVDHKFRGKGIGKLLLNTLLVECEKGPWRQVIAIIGNSQNKGSIALHESVGFRVVGTIEAVGYKLDQWVDTVIMQRSIGDGSAAKPGA